MKIRMIQNDIKIEMTLEDNKTSRDLYNQLPLKIKVEDYASNEKIFYPPKKLSIEGAPKSYKPSKGDVTYYSPWGDVAIFYKDFSDSKGLVKLGRVTSEVDQLLKLKDSEVTIEKVR